MIVLSFPMLIILEGHSIWISSSISPYRKAVSIPTNLAKKLTGITISSYTLNIISFMAGHLFWEILTLGTWLYLHPINLAWNVPLHLNVSTNIHFTHLWSGGISFLGVLSPFLPFYYISKIVSYCLMTFTLWLLIQMIPSFDKSLQFCFHSHFVLCCHSNHRQVSQKNYFFFYCFLTFGLLKDFINIFIIRNLHFLLLSLPLDLKLPQGGLFQLFFSSKCFTPSLLLVLSFSILWFW